MPLPPASEQAAVSAITPSKATDNAVSLVEENQRMWGFVKWYCPLKGCGVVRCRGIPVFLERSEAEKVPDLITGAGISFTLRFDALGRPQACDINMIMHGAPRGPHRMKLFAKKCAGITIDWNKTYVGKIVRSYRETGPLPVSMQKKDLGFGFIACDETYRLFEHDIWAYPSQLVGYKVGDFLAFKVKIDHYWSYPVAINIRAASADEAASASTLLSAPIGNDVTRKSDLPKLKSSTLSPQLAGTSPAVPPAVAGQRQRSTSPRSAGTAATTANVAAVTASAGADAVADGPASPSRGGERDDVEEQPAQAGGLLERPAPAVTAGGAGVDAAEADGGDPQAHSHAEASGWQRFATLDGLESWWWCQSDGDWFLESAPGAWSKYTDPHSNRSYWWNSNGKWFWA
mmetsp:Transcript_63942/g.177760  ORF Transcript_63942/g.177760 Transcript_63942/m.177760 type:complete len:402 (-) Transcript_63942:126-1331(-)